MSLMLKYKHMKLRSTTPASISFKARVMLAVVAVIMAFATPAQIMFDSSNAIAAKSSSQIEAEIRALREDLNRYEAEAAKLRGYAATLKDAVAQFSAEKSAIQAQINLNQAEYNSLTKQITETEDQIEQNRNSLGDTIADIHIEDQISPIEMIFSSKNISSFLDRQEYRNSVRDELKRTNDEIKVLKAELEKKKTAVETILNDQKRQRDILAAKEAEQQRLLSQTKGSEAMYTKLAKEGQNEYAKLNAQYAAALQQELAAMGGGGTTSTNYKYKNKSTNYNNACVYYGSGGRAWDEWGYCYRQCTSYVAWRLAGDPRNTINYSYLGNAYNWFNKGRTVAANDIQYGDVIVRDYMPSRPWGHVMYVESVSNGTVYYTDYNGIGGAVSPGAGNMSVSSATTGYFKVIRFR